MDFLIFLCLVIALIAAAYLSANIYHKIQGRDHVLKGKAAKLARTKVTVISSIVTVVFVSYALMLLGILPYKSDKIYTPSKPLAVMTPLPQQSSNNGIVTTQVWQKKQRKGILKPKGAH
jgi:uncharacterized membrane protein